MKACPGTVLAAIAALFLLATFPLPTLAQEAGAATGSPVKKPAEHVYVSLVTELGAVTLDLDATHAPLTTANFLKYVDSKRLDGATFYLSRHAP